MSNACVMDRQSLQNGAELQEARRQSGAFPRK
jgi:hypothetical protein